MSSAPALHVCLIGYGAIGQAIVQRLPNHQRVKINHVVVRNAAHTLPKGIQAVSAVPSDAQLVLECAGHSALHEHVLPALKRGIDCAVLSVGALAEVGLPEALANAAQEGGAQLHLLPGAIGGIDAIAAA
ncbi:MAG: aspartate dehydrogenase, partial [Brachymonas sp.]|nr:aspartate dehydrogenase [Brachymonas sp.]